MRDLAGLIEKVEALEGPSREVDGAVWCAVNGYPFVMWDGAGCVYRGKDGISHIASNNISNYTASLDAAVALVERVLPGWSWRVATCHVSDDAWLIPDFNHPIHGERLMREFGKAEGDPSAYWQEATDVDLRPSGRPAIALILALLRVLSDEMPS
jgi:hypothetical protein